MIKNCFCLKTDAEPQTILWFTGLHRFARKDIIYVFLCNLISLTASYLQD
jgi:hypothetical protein